MNNINEIKYLVKKICSEDDVLMVDHDLNISILDDKLSDSLRSLVKDMTFTELNRVAGYFIEELEGDGIDMNDSEMDNPDTYLAFCINVCEQSDHELRDYVNLFKETNNL